MYWWAEERGRLGKMGRRGYRNTRVGVAIAAPRSGKISGMFKQTYWYSPLGSVKIQNATPSFSPTRIINQGDSQPTRSGVRITSATAGSRRRVIHLKENHFSPFVGEYQKSRASWEWCAVTPFWDHILRVLANNCGAMKIGKLVFGGEVVR